MKFLKKKNKAFLIALMLILMATSIIVALPLSNAHTPPWNIPTHAYVSCTPATIGVGQYTNIVVWVDRYSPTSAGTQGQRLTGFTLDITKPDGTKQTIGPWTCGSAVGSDAIPYTPTQIGTYTIVFSWPGNTIAPGPENFNTGQGVSYIGDFLEGATSQPYTLKVTQEDIPNWPEAPLPTDYWTRPINAANRGWSTIGSNWLKGSWLVNNFQTSGTVPLSAHVLWSKPITVGRAGGISDARWPGIPADVNDYETPWSSPIVMNGVIYYNSPPVADSAQYGYYAMDLYTGQQLWYKNGTDNGLENPSTKAGGYSLSLSYPSLTQGQLYHYNSVNGQGILSYLIMVQGSTWYFLDAATGNFMLKLINVPGGTAVTDQDGSLLRYSYNAATGRLLCWNSSQSIPPLGPEGTNQQQWKMRFGATIDAVNDSSWTIVGPNNSTAVGNVLVFPDDILPRSGYTMNVTIDKNLPGDIFVLQDANRVSKEIFGAYMTAPMSDLTSSDYTTGRTLGSGDTFSIWTASINEHVTGYSPPTANTNTQANNLGFGATVLLYKNLTVPVPGENLTWVITGPDYGSQTFQLWCKQLGQSWTYSLGTGEKLWGPTTSFHQMDYYGLSQNVYYDKLIQISQYGGTMAAYDITNGNLLWVYNATGTSPYEAYYGEYMTLSLGAVVDGCAILFSNEHSPTKPLWRDSYVRCVNLTDGTEIWRLLDFNMGLSVADGYIVTGNAYDNNIYCIGKGPSGTTVNAPQSGIFEGNSFTITGTVTDQSPGAVAYANKFGLLNGVPAVSDDSQQAFMEYLYEQQPKPTNVVGITVNIDAIDPNGNYVNLGTSTTDDRGFYSFQVNPDMLAAGSGTYQVIATFAGSNSYGSSSSKSAFTLNSAAPTASPYPVASLPPTEMYIIGGVAAIIIAIAIVGVVLLIAIRKRP